MCISAGHMSPESIYIYIHIYSVFVLNTCEHNMDIYIEREGYIYVFILHTYAYIYISLHVVSMYIYIYAHVLIIKYMIAWSLDVVLEK